MTTVDRRRPDARLKHLTPRYHPTMKIAPLLVLAALAGGCSRRSPDHAEQPVARNAAMAQARSAVAETETAVLADRVHALEVEVAQMRNAPEVANMQLLDARVKALELKVYAQDAAPATATPPAKPAPAGARRTPAADARTVVNPFPTYRRPTQDERDAADRIAR